MKRAVPRPRPGTDPAVAVLKENMEILTGQRGSRIEPLASTATTAEIIAKINEILDRLQ